MIPVVPAAHYNCGGVATDLNGQTTIKGLYAGGEVACTGVHGANRLASNSLLEAAVFGKAAAIHSIAYVNATPAPPPVPSVNFTFENTEYGYETNRTKSCVQNLMWKYAGILRSMEGLSYCYNQLIQAEKNLERLMQDNYLSISLKEIQNILITSKLIVTAALQRKENKGGHYLIDQKHNKESVPYKKERLARQK